ncbi:hypothetical protein PENSPDRAFT_737054 [Peniophora sp. CONT]|nr:hypothetical protein PENSPDRAFT_737054 [Peniophora sp. CONT]
MTWHRTLHQQYLEAYMTYMALRMAVLPPESASQLLEQVKTDCLILYNIFTARYLNTRVLVPKRGNFSLAWDYASDPALHDRFVTMFRISPHVFEAILHLIRNHAVFQNKSNNEQTDPRDQFAVTLYRMGRFGNGVSVRDVARDAGISEGAVHDFTERCQTAIMSLHDQFVRPLTAEEKEVEKCWIEEQLGVEGSTWRDGYLMYDGTIIVFYGRPGMDGAAYYTRKQNYGFNAQIGNAPSNLRIVDYCVGLTGSAHDSTAFKHTAAGRWPDWLFEGKEFAWADSAYDVDKRTIPVHKKPEADHPPNRLFDRVVAGKLSESMIQSSANILKAFEFVRSTAWVHSKDAGSLYADFVSPSTIRATIIERRAGCPAALFCIMLSLT